MTILHFVHVFPPESQGGTETYVQALAAAQRERGIDAVVGCGSENVEHTEVAEERDGAVRVFRFGENGSKRDLDWSCPSTATEVEQVIDAVQPRLVHVHHWHNLSHDLVRIAKRRDLPVVVTLSDYFVTCPLFFRVPNEVDTCPPSVMGETCVQCIVEKVGFEEEATRAAFARRQPAFREELLAADRILTLSGAQRAFMLQMPQFEGLSIRPVPYPSPVVEPSPDAAPPPREGRPLSIISWGGLVRGKGFHLIVEACERLRDPSKVAVHHYGTIIDEAYRDEILQAAKRTEVTFHGRFGRSELTTLFPGHDLAIFPSFFMETHGLVVDEAIQLGLPVFVSDRGAPPERIGERGAVFEAGHVGALATLIDRAVEMKAYLPQLRAPVIPEPYTMEHHMRDVLGIYSDLLGEPVGELA